jgi:hypothetical protein
VDLACSNSCVEEAAAWWVTCDGLTEGLWHRNMCSLGRKQNSVNASIWTRRWSAWSRCVNVREVRINRKNINNKWYNF